MSSSFSLHAKVWRKGDEALSQIKRLPTSIAVIILAQTPDIVVVDCFGDFDLCFCYLNVSDWIVARGFGVEGMTRPTD